MRYKFRGRRVDNGEWVYGNLFQEASGKLYINQSYYDGEMLEFEENEVDPETVGQQVKYYGHDFFEGDIFSITCDCDSEYGCSHPDAIHILVWSDEYAGFVLENKSGRKFALDEFGEENMHVIGNIHQHKHLLGE